MEVNHESVTVVDNSVVKLTFSEGDHQVDVNVDAFLTIQQAEFFESVIRSAVKNVPVNYSNLWFMADDIQRLISKFKSVGWIIV